MRYFSSFGSMAMAAIFLSSGSAFALEAGTSFTDLTGFGGDGNIVGDRIDGLVIGDRFEVGISLDNSAGDDILSVFTYLTFDSEVISIVDGFSDTAAFPAEPGPGGNLLISVGAPEEVLGLPQGVASGISLTVSNPASGDGVYSSTNSGFVAVAIFEVVGSGFISIRQIDSGNTILNGTSGGLVYGPRLIVDTRDEDADLVPDTIDNCVDIPNGPNEGALNQLDANQDGYGNACDADYTNDGVVDGFDWGPLVCCFSTADSVIDLTGDGIVDGGDFGPFIDLFNAAPGPSGLDCAGTIPCVP